ncbi:MAG: Rieske 2Fe-2S domain-containing protein [Thermoplasmata archaeon]
MESTARAWQRLVFPGRPLEGATTVGTLAEGDRAMLLRSAGSLYATQANCGHMWFPLGDGKIFGTLLTCPLHRAQFDLTTGGIVRGPQIPGLLKATKMGEGILSVDVEPLRTYDVEERGDGIFVRPRTPP